MAEEKVEERKLDVGLQPSVGLSVALPWYPSGPSNVVAEEKVGERALDVGLQPSVASGPLQPSGSSKGVAEGRIEEPEALTIQLMHFPSSPCWRMCSKTSISIHSNFR